MIGHPYFSHRPLNPLGFPYSSRLPLLQLALPDKSDSGDVSVLPTHHSGIHPLLFGRRITKIYILIHLIISIHPILSECSPRNQLSALDRTRSAAFFLTECSARNRGSGLERSRARIRTILPGIV